MAIRDPDLHLHNVVYRRATFEDLEAILDIDRNIYEGFDSVWCDFPNVIKAPNLIAVVCENILTGQLVAYCHGYVMAGGRYVVSQSRRVRAELRHMGYGNELHRFLSSECQKEFPMVGDNLHYTAYHNFYLDREKYAPQHEIIAKRHRIQYLIEYGQLDALHRECSKLVEGLHFTWDVVPIDDASQIICQSALHRNRLNVFTAYHVFMANDNFSPSEIPTTNPFHSIVFREKESDKIIAVAILLYFGHNLAIEVHMIESHFDDAFISEFVSSCLLEGSVLKEVELRAPKHLTDNLSVMIKFCDNFNKESVKLGLRNTFSLGIFQNMFGKDIPQTVVKKDVHYQSSEV